jgi:hypothetical protein
MLNEMIEMLPHLRVATRKDKSEKERCDVGNCSFLLEFYFDICPSNKPQLSDRIVEVAL